MPRYDKNGRELKVVLTYILNRVVTDNEICTAIGVNRNTYYAKRRDADDYPNAEECRLLALHFGLNPVELQLVFGLLSPADIVTRARIDHNGTHNGSMTSHLLFSPDGQATPSPDEERSTVGPAIEATANAMFALLNALPNSDVAQLNSNIENIRKQLRRNYDTDDHDHNRANKNG